MGKLTNSDKDGPGWVDLWTIEQTTTDPALKSALGKMNLGRPVTFTPEIGGFICNLVSLGHTISSICNIYNEINPKVKLSKGKIYQWLNNTKFKAFYNDYYYARELSTNGILDDIIDLENDIISDAVSFKSGRVVLESKRWRAKVQNPGYFNPVDKTEIDDKREIIIKASIPIPLPLPDRLLGQSVEQQVIEGTFCEAVEDVDVGTSTRDGPDRVDCTLPAAEDGG